MASPPPLVAGVELGGSHAVVLVGRSPGDLARRTELPLGAPAETLGAVVCALAPVRDLLGAVGVASFGPLRHGGGAALCGLGRTPKPGWSGVDLVAPLETALGCPVLLDTDVNLAALGEARWGSGRGADPLVYLTVGTGIGGGVLLGGRPHHGRLHPELGHLRLRRLQGDDFPGICPFHGDCWEGLASGPALAARWGQSPALLPDDHPAWELEARLLARGVAALGLVLAPSRVILGGGVLTRAGLLERTRTALVAEVGEYGPLVGRAPDPTFLVGASLAPDAGAWGALALAADHAALSGVPAAP